MLTNGNEEKVLVLFNYCNNCTGPINISPFCLSDTLGTNYWEHIVFTENSGSLEHSSVGLVHVKVYEESTCSIVK